LIYMACTMASYIDIFHLYKSSRIPHILHHWHMFRPM